MKRKRIDLLAPPFKGHLHPILAIAKLLANDYEIKVLSSAAAKADIEAAGLCPVLLTSIDDKALIECVNPTYAVRSSPFKLFAQFKQVIVFFQQLKSELESIYSDNHPDLIIADFTLPIVGIIANQKQIAWWTSMPSPCVIECSGGPPSYMGGWKEGKNLLTKARNWAGRKLVRAFKKLVFYLCKKHIRSLGLEKIYRKDGTEAIYSNECILCLGYREFEFSKPWPDATQFVGPMLYSPKLPHEPPVFQSDKQYILVTLGTHLDWCKEAIYREIEGLVDQFPDIVFHFTAGNSESNTYLKSHNQCLKFAYINYETHLPKYDFVIHHGGAGILYYCIQYAKPSIVIPQDYDQFDHAARLEALGLAIWVKSLKELPIALQKLRADSNIEKKIMHFYRRCSKSHHIASISKLVDHKLRLNLH